MNNRTSAEPKQSMPVLVPCNLEEFWEKVRLIVREEITRMHEKLPVSKDEVPGLTYKPLYKIEEVCQLFKVTKPTIYDWIKHDKLKPFKIRSRVYFLWNDLQELLSGKK